MKKKSIVASLMTIMMSASLIAGGTYALFTSESTVNVAVTSGTVDVVATVDEDSITYGSTLGANLAQTAVTFSKTSNTISLEYLVPGDYVEFDLTITNNSTVTAKYQTAVSVVEDMGLFAGLDVTIGGETGYGAQEKASKWATIEPNQTIDNVSVRIELPERSGLTFGAENKDNQYQGKSCKLAYVVRAVQDNAPTYDPVPPVGVSELTEEQLEVLANEIGTFGGVNSLIKDPNATMDIVVGRSYSIAEASNAISVSQYGTWATDFEIYFNNDITYVYNADDAIVPVNADLFLIGEYGSFGWIPVPLIMPSMADGSKIIKGDPNADGEFTLTLKAEKPVRIMDTFIKALFNGNGFFTYNDIATLVGTFNCGIVLDGTMLGIGDGVPPANTTATLSLNLYETKDGEEVAGGVKQTVHTFTTPIVDETVSTADELYSAINAGKSTIKIDGMITLNKGLTIDREMSFIGIDQNSGIDFAGHNIVGNGSAISYKNLYLKTVSLPQIPESGERYGWYGGIDYKGHSVANYMDCTIQGVFTGYSTTVNATGCTFLPYMQDDEEFYNVFQYGSKVVNLTGCTFYYADRAIKIYNEGGTKDLEMNIEGCTFKAAENLTLNKALVEIDDTYLTSVKLTWKNNTVDSALASLDTYKVKVNISKVTANVQ